MTDRSVAHGSFTVERTYRVSPERVFAAWSSQPAKTPWFGDDEDLLATTGEYTLDFRVGGHERLDGTLHNGATFTYDAYYHDIVEDRRIVAAYDVLIGGRRVSVSLLTVELVPVAGGTRLVLTEQGAFLDGLDTNGQREEGARDSLDRLGDYLRAQGE
jgi:uncharacterized protein YndB with AHSA1/START domain